VWFKTELDERDKDKKKDKKMDMDSPLTLNYVILEALLVPRSDAP
jgi:hypothetical protein